MVLIADGQVTQGGTVVKPNVRKTRKIGEHAIGGFAGEAISYDACSPNSHPWFKTLWHNPTMYHAGATADAFTLFERLEGKLEEHPGGECCCLAQLQQVAVGFGNVITAFLWHWTCAIQQCHPRTLQELC